MKFGLSICFCFDKNRESNEEFCFFCCTIFASTSFAIIDETDKNKDDDDTDEDDDETVGLIDAIEFVVLE